MKKLLKAVLVMAMVLGFAGGVYAQPATSNMQVTGNANGLFTVTAYPLNFGTFDNTVDGSILYQSTDIVVKGPTGTPYNVALGMGLNSDGNRRMKNASTAEYVYYHTYQDAGHTIEWGDGWYGNLLAGTATGLDQNHTVYGALTTALVSSGNYADTAAVTVTW